MVKATSLDVELALKEHGDLDELVTVEEEGKFVVVRAKGWLGEDWHKVNDVLHLFEVEWVKSGKLSHWRIPLESIMKVEPKAVSIETMMPKTETPEITKIVKEPSPTIQTEDGRSKQTTQPQNNASSVIQVGDEEVDLALSKEKVGPLVPILKDKYGNVIDGLHRLKVDKEWPSITLEHIQDPVQLALARIVANVQRRDVDADPNELSELLGQVSRLTGWHSPQIANAVGMSTDWVLKYLPDEVKDKKMQAVRQHRTEPIFKQELYNVWSFGKCDSRFGKANFPGRIPGQIVTQLLYYYTNEGNLVVDPMAGSGTTYDACQYMRRKCLVYDITPIRDFIKQNDIRNGYPAEAHRCDLIFLDPPYWKMKKEDYGFDSASNEPLAEFMQFLEKLAKDSYETVKPLGVVAILMQDMTEKANFALSAETYILFKRVGFSCIQHISCPLSTQQFLPQQVEQAKKEKHILGRNRDLYVFRRP